MARTDRRATDKIRGNDARLVILDDGNNFTPVKKPTFRENLVDVLDLFTMREKEVMVNAWNHCNGRHISIGVLPFCNRKTMLNNIGTYFDDLMGSSFMPKQSEIDMESKIIAKLYGVRKSGRRKAW
jgi:hypothetical protein